MLLIQCPWLAPFPIFQPSSRTLDPSTFQAPFGRPRSPKQSPLWTTTGTTFDSKCLHGDDDNDTGYVLPFMCVWCRFIKLNTGPYITIYRIYLKLNSNYIIVTSNSWYKSFGLPFPNSTGENQVARRDPQRWPPV